MATAANVPVTDELAAVFTNYLSDWMKNTSTITGVVVGKLGAGKSTLINSILGLIGRTQAVERHRVLPKATKLKLYQNTVGNVQLQLWDTPSLLAPDGTKSKEWSIDNIKRSCKDIDLCLFCIDMSKLRSIEHEHREAVRLLNKTFGCDIWKNTMFVLTFANEYLCQTNAEYEGQPKEQERDFEEQVGIWKKKLHEAFEKEKMDARNLKVVPAGTYDHHSHQPLPLSENIHTTGRWLNELWREVISTVKPSAAPAALKVYKHLSSRDEQDRQASQSSSIQHPITLTLLIKENFEIIQTGNQTPGATRSSETL